MHFFRISLRGLRDELEGRSPPIRWWEIQSPIWAWVNPRPCTPIFITRTCRGGRCDPPPHSRFETKGRIVELRGKHRRIALDE